MVLSYCRVPVWIVTPSQLQNPSQFQLQNPRPKLNLPQLSQRPRPIRFQVRFPRPLLLSSQLQSQIPSNLRHLSHHLIHKSSGNVNH